MVGLPQGWATLILNLLARARGLLPEFRAREVRTVGDLVLAQTAVYRRA